jgi:DNA polymerase-1
MLLNADVKSLELVTCADLSGEKLLANELARKFDIHADNQKRFGFPLTNEGRVRAKRFVFKLIYGATAYGYTTDSDFIDVGYSQKEWQKIIDAFYEKYPAIKKWHDELLIEVMRNGYLEIPSGRIFFFKKNAWDKWPITQIKNYPVQGWGADLVKLARIEACRRVSAIDKRCLFVGTIHDSLVFDIPDEMCYTISMAVKNAIEAVPELSEKAYGYRLSLPLFCEIKVGQNKYDMTELKL